uniref:Protein phosphatase 1 regulatory subunit 36 n=1 Tax=Heliothis virescens TaxID=7102 RepID=A0A2A4JBG2_HELVI
MSSFDDDDDEVAGGIYENGHWAWDDKENEIVFKNDLPVKTDETPQMATAILGSVEFKEDIDLNEQQRFRKRIQRKVTAATDYVTLQDVKDVVFFTAPFKIMKPYVINLFHLPATDRILRALIMFCQYHLQISNLMAMRTLELETKIHTSASHEKELFYLENLEDLRLLVAKEYANMIQGSGDFGKYHHMGPTKKLRSQIRRESFMFETFIRISIQIIWIALGRKSFVQIELEVHRIFKSPLFNSAEHKLGKGAPTITSNERTVLLGHCLRKKYKVEMLSPLINEVHCCRRNIDHRIYGLGVVKYPNLSPRLLYMEGALSLPERELLANDISLGILGWPRSNFDILLREIVYSPDDISMSSTKLNKSVSKASKGLQRTRSTIVESTQMYKDIEIPPPSDEE